MVNNYALHNVETLRFWCRKVLPLVYDDSLSYYEVLCKVVAKLNEVIDNEDAQNEVIRQLNENVETLAEAQTEQYNELLGMIEGAITSIGSLQTGKVDKAQSASDNGKVLGIVNGQVTPVELPADNVFYATYNVTPFSEIYSAWDNDLLVVVSRVNQQGHYEHAVLSDISTTTATFIIPASPSDGSYEKITCTASGWDVETVQYSEELVYVANTTDDDYASITAQIENGKTIILKVYSEALGSYVVYTNVVGSVSEDPILEPNPYVKFVCYDGKHIYTAIINSLNQWTQNIENSHNVFIAEYGTTTYAEIASAITDGKIVFCNSNNSYAPLTNTSLNTFTFASSHTTSAFIMSVTSSNIWANKSYDYSKIFYVTQYGTGATTYNDILYHYNQGYVCTLKINSILYIATQIEDGAIVFTNILTDTINYGTGILYEKINSNNVWTHDHNDFVCVQGNTQDIGKTLVVDANGAAIWEYEKIFIGDYSTTTYAEIYQAAFNEGKFIVIADLTSMRYYTAAFADLQGRLYFTCDNKLIYIDPVNGWSNEIDNSPVFYATENVTTFDEIATAYRAGKVCCVNDGNDIYTLSYIAFDTGATFAHPTANGNSFKGVSISDVWS